VRRLVVADPEVDDIGNVRIQFLGGASERGHTLALTRGPQRRNGCGGSWEERPAIDQDRRWDRRAESAHLPGAPPVSAMGRIIRELAYSA
jgi:hypothetical protein